MIRSKFRRTLRLESLESRQLLSGPTDQQQYMLELLNEARTNPVETAERVTTNLDGNVQETVKHYNVDLNHVRHAIAGTAPKPPLAWDDKLAAAAQGQSQDQANTGVQSHNGSDGSDLTKRLDRVGYDDRTAQGENAFAYATGIDEAMDAFLIDWGVADGGHRENILQPKTPDDNVYREVGIGIVKSNRGGIGPYVVTQNFGAQEGDKPDLLGVAYNDPTNSNTYAPGQGRGDVTIDARNTATGQVSSVNTWKSGGYQMPLDPGTYEVTARVGDKVVKTQDVTIGSQNVKVDYDLSEPWEGNANPPKRAVPAPPPPPPVVVKLDPPPPPVVVRVDTPPPPVPPVKVEIPNPPPDLALKLDPPPPPPVVAVKLDPPLPPPQATVTLPDLLPTTSTASSDSAPMFFQANVQTEPAANLIAQALDAPPTSGFDFGWTTWKAKKS